MGSLPFIPEPLGGDAGFATPAAVVISLAIATIAVAVQVNAVTVLHASQADYIRTGAELRLDGAELIAAAELAAGQSAERGRWAIALHGAPIQIQAEPEAAKLSYAAAGLDPGVLTALGASHPERIQAALTQMTPGAELSPDDIAALDVSPLWKACAPQTLSAYGQARSLDAVRQHGASPQAALLQAGLGQVWRIRVSDGWGWTQARLVRFVGDRVSPVRIIFRSFKRLRSGDRSCPLTSPPAA